jgi:uncharacterized protein (TIGR03067 family)
MSRVESQDLEKLQGTWYVTDVEADGAAMPVLNVGQASITLDGKRFTSEGLGHDYSGVIEIFSSQNPKAFDLTFTAGPPEGLVNRGIYRLEGDAWTICLATRGGARPKSFATRADSGLVLERLERRARKDPPVSRPSTTQRAPEASVGAATDIEGEWAMVSGVFGGKPLAPAMAAWCTRVTRGDTTRVLAGPQTMLDATFTTDRSRTPHTIDYVNRSGAHKGKRQLGIYEISGGELHVCVAAPGDARPSGIRTIASPI